MSGASSQGVAGLAAWPSVGDAKPDEEGGPTARKGFNYQDEITAGFLIEMLASPALTKVHCETHDDIVLVREFPDHGINIAEYVQVKAHEQDSLWSVADLCRRKKNTAGTSIFEKSLGRDKHKEISIFRLVTLRPVVSALEPLSYGFASVSRDPGSKGMKALKDELDNRFPGVASPKGNGTDFWLKNCFWDQRHSEDAVRKDNLLRLIRFSIKDARPLLPEQAEGLLDELRAWAKAAGDFKWAPDRDKKIITRSALLAWWEERMTELTEGAAAKSGGKLVGKMEDAELSDDLIAMAVEMRRDYAAETRAPRYLEVDDAERLRRRVRSEVQSLRARFVAGQIDVDPPGFHFLCLDRMDAVNAERIPGTEDQSAFLKGCMYDIADRCLLRFVRRS